MNRSNISYLETAPYFIYESFKFTIRQLIRFRPKYSRNIHKLNCLISVHCRKKQSKGINTLGTLYMLSDNSIIN